MDPPFTADAFFQTFANYNRAVWPMPVVLVGVAVAMVALALRGRGGSGRTIALGLGGLWVWMGLAYHARFFADVNPAAPVFAVAFVAEGIALAWAGLRPDGLRFGPPSGPGGVAGGVLLAYALVLYPVLGAVAGHVYPAQPTFGLPCPTTIFTMGLLLWARGRVPWGLLLVPAAWSLIGMSAVTYFGVLEDAMLPVAGILGGTLVLWRNRGAPSDRA